MTKLATELQNAIVADLNGTTLPFANGAAVPDLVPKRDLREVAAQARLLVVVGDRIDDDAAGTRARSEKTQDVQVGFLHKLSSGQPPPTEFQPLIDFVDTTLPGHFRGKVYELPSGTKAHATGVEYRPLYSPDHVLEFTQFTSVLVFTFISI